jgi:gluconokinase
MPDYILGTDIGTGSTKTVAVDLSGKPLSTSQYAYPTIHPLRGHCEQDPRQILDAFLKSIRDTISKLGRPPSTISLSSAMHGIMAVDKQGEPLSNLIIWSDLRSMDIAARIRKSPQAGPVYFATGTPVHAMSPLCKIIWLRENMPELFESAHKFISIKEYIWHHLFREFRIDHSVASATGLFHIEKLDWDEHALRLAGITKERLSSPVPTNYMRSGISSEMASVMDLPESIAFCIGASDGCLANLGTRSMEPGVAAITIGTSGAVRIASPAPIREPSIMPFNYILDEKTFICGGPMNNGGNIVEWLLKNFLEQETVTEEHYTRFFDAIEKVPPGSGGLVFLPYLNGERAPVWDEQSCGVYFGIRPQHGRSHFLRAALEGICFAIRHILTSLEELSQPIHQLHLSGGFTRSDLWMQLLSDITGKKISVQHTEDASAIGAALLALKAQNRMPGPSNDKKLAAILPQQQFSEVYEINYRIFQTLYPSLKNSMHLLEQLVVGS